MTNPVRDPISPGVWSRLLAWPGRHPVGVLVMTALLVAISVAAVSRYRVATHLDAMIARGDSASRALARIVRAFPASDRLLLLISAPDSDNSPPARIADRLIDTAARVARELSADPTSASLIESVAFRSPHDEAKDFIGRIAAPAALYYLDDSAWDELRRRLTPEGMAERLNRLEILLSMPGNSGPVVALATRDPLGIHELLSSRLSKLQKPLKTFEDGPEWVSSDGRRILVVIGGRQPAGNMAFTRSLMACVRRALDRAGAADPVAWGGGYAIAEACERAIRSDMIASITGSLLIMQAAFLLAFRGWIAFPLTLLPTVIGVLVGFAAWSLITTDLMPPTAVIAAILGGLGVDYAIHYLSRVDSTCSGAAPASRGIERAMGTAFVTTGATFLIIRATDMPAMRDFAAIGLLGLGAALFFTLTLLPALRSLPSALGQPLVPRLRLDGLFAWIVCHRVPVMRIGILLGGVLVFALALTPGPILPLEADLAVMHPDPRTPLEVQDRVSRLFGLSAAPLLVHLAAPTPDSLVACAFDAERRIREAAERAGIPVTAIIGPESLLPDPRHAKRRKAEATALDGERVVADFAAAVAASPFDPLSFAEYGSYLRDMLRPPPPPSLIDLRRFPGLSGSILPRSDAPAADWDALMLVSVDAPLTIREHRDRAVSAIRNAVCDLPGATLTGMSVMAYDLEAAVWHDLIRLSALSLLAVLVMLGLAFRDLSETVQALLPLAFALVFVWAAARWTGLSFNLVNLVSLPLLAGVGVDNGIYLISATRACRGAGMGPPVSMSSMTSVLRAILLSNITTGIGFGSLAFTRTAAIASLGHVFATGLVGLLVGTLVLTAIRIRGITLFSESAHGNLAP